MRRWVVGWNQPGCLPDDEPSEVETWVEARNLLRTEIGQHFLNRVADDETTTRKDMFAYTRASATMRKMPPDEPFSLFYDGWVWWMADL